MGQFSAGHPAPGSPPPIPPAFSGMSPPTMPGEVTPPHAQSKWPRVLGIIMIVLGSLATLGSCFGTVALFFQDKLMDFAASASGKGSPAAQDLTIQAAAIVKWKWASFGSNVFLMVCAVLCLVAGIGILKRRAGGVTQAKLWAVLKMVAAVVGGVVGFLMQRDIFQAMQQAGTTGANMPAGVAGAMQGVQAAMLFGSVVWQWALPVFVLVWLSRAKVREETSLWA